MGLTALQMFALVCMACAAFAALGAGGWLILSGAGLGDRLQPATATPGIIPTSSPVPTATITLTPTATGIPYESFIPPGWQQFRNERVEIWLPAEFPVESSEEYNAALVRGLRQVGQETTANELEQQPPVNELSFHKLTLGQPLETSLYVRQNPSVSASLSAYADQRFADLPPTITIVERNEFEMFRTPGVRVVLQANFNSTYVGYVYYLIKDGNAVWEIGCLAGLTDFFTLLPTFDRIAQTFRAVH